MALTTTTNSAAIAQGDTSITVASATSMQAGMLIRINGEWMQIAKNYVSGTSIPVYRGQDGSVQSAHAVTSNVTFGVASDFAATGNWPGGVPDAVTAPVQPAFPIKAYGAAGALDLRQHIAIINGTAALAMTLASPTKDMDGQIMIVVSNGKAAHTVTLTAGFGANTTNSDVLTFHATQTQAVQYIAANGVWALVGQVAGAASVAGVGLG